MSQQIHGLRQGAILAIAATDTANKVALTRQLWRRWKQGGLSRCLPSDPPLPNRPGRPDKPELVPPTQVKKRSLNTVRGRVALIHALAHIELNAIDLALDIVARFADHRIPPSFFAGWLGVADDEARHFSLLSQRLVELGSHYGALPAHDGLWQAAYDTRNDLYARLAVVPLILEARGLDVTPSLIVRLNEFGDHETSSILEIIYEDEKGHVAVGAKWFRFFCKQKNLDPALTFQKLVRRNFRGQLKAPFNMLARAEAGLTPSFYRTLSTPSR